MGIATGFPAVLRAAPQISKRTPCATLTLGRERPVDGFAFP